MRRSSALIASCLFVLTACMPVDTPGEGASSFSSSTSPVDPSEAQAWAMIRSWAPSLEWSEPVAGMNDETINVDEERSIPADSVQTRSVMATVDAQEYVDVFLESREKLDDAAERQGWEKHVWFDADGATGTQWGYVMIDDDGMRFLIIVANGATCAETNDGPRTCTEYEANVTLTDSVSF